MKKLAVSSSLFLAMFGAVACNQATAMSKAPPVITGLQPAEGEAEGAPKGKKT